MERKEIMLSDYLQEVFTTLNKFVYSGIEGETIEPGVLHAHATMFFNIFGVEVAEKLVEAYTDSDVSRDFDYEYCRSLALLYKNLNKADVDEFIDTVRVYCNRKSNN